MTRLTKKEQRQLDKAIEAAFYSCCGGVQVPILDIPDIFAHGRSFLLSPYVKKHGIGQELRSYCRERGYEGA